MQAAEFIRKWQPGAPANDLNERAGAQAHFIDLCRLLGVPEPADPEHYCFERGVTKTGSMSIERGGRTDGFADVWLRGHFAWEYKAPGKSLEGALKQRMMYALPLENPPLLVVSDRLRIEVHTHFTGTPSECHRFALEEQRMTNDPSHRAMLSRLGTTFGPWCLALLLACLGSASTAQEQRPDPLAQLGRFVGTWSGTSMGQPGEGAVSRTYAKVMQGRYVQETNVSRYPPKEAGKAGEVHEHLSMFSYDKARKAIVLRQFHIESFVNTFRQISAPGEFPMVFESESFENFSNSWKARETYEFVSDDEFVETFELAPPGKPFQVYSVNRLKRAVK